jgi:hypothetical protein
MKNIAEKDCNEVKACSVQSLSAHKSKVVIKRPPNADLFTTVRFLEFEVQMQVW